MSNRVQKAVAAFQRAIERAPDHLLSKPIHGKNTITDLMCEDIPLDVLEEATAKLEEWCEQERAKEGG